MKKILLAILLASLLVFGCVGVPGTDQATATSATNGNAAQSGGQTPVSSNDDLPPPLPE